MRIRHIIASVLLIAAGIGCTPDSEGAELGVSLLEHRARHNTAEAARGWDLRLHFGEEAEWTVSVGGISEREPSLIDGYIDTPAGCCAAIDEIPSYKFVTVARRVFWQPDSFQTTRLFAGVGLAYVDGEVCTIELLWDAKRINKATPSSPYCWDGTVEVSSDWTYNLTFGVKWSHVELAWDHWSTGRNSWLNMGDDVFRLSFITKIFNR